MDSILSGVMNNYFWFIVAIGCGIGEIFTTTFYLLPFALGGLVAGLSSLIGAGLTTQWIIFFLFSVVGIIFVVRYASPKDRDGLSTTGSFRYVGEKFILNSTVGEFEPADVIFQGDSWKVVSKSGEIKEDTLVKVIAVDGTKLVVEKV